MKESGSSSDRSVTVSVELNGNYDDVVGKLRKDGSGSADLNAILEDLSAVLETVRALDGGTRSAIAETLPDDTAVADDAEGVVDALQLLHRYDLVVLEGNTWAPAGSA